MVNKLIFRCSWFFVIFGEVLPGLRQNYLSSQQFKVALPYICRLMLLILFTWPSTVPLLQGRRIPFSTALISQLRPLANVLKPDNLCFERFIKSIHLFILPQPFLSIVLKI